MDCPGRYPKRERLNEVREFGKTPDAQVGPQVVDAFDKLAAESDADYDRRIAALKAGIDESRAIRVRDQAFDMLANVTSPAVAAQQLIGDVSDDELGVIVDEVPRWLANRGHDTSFIPTVLERRDPELGKAATRRQKSDQVEQIAKQTATQIEIGIQSGCPARHLMSSEDVRRYDPDV